VTDAEARAGADARASRTPRAPPLPPFTRVWRRLYEVIYRGIEGIARILFRPLFRVRRAGAARPLPTSGVLLCPNHQSYLDPALVQLVVRRHLTFVMTNDFYAVPLARGFFRLVGAIPVARGRLAFTSMRRAAALLRLGRAVVVFPEGRLSLDGTLHRFQRGIGYLARRGRAPVVPVAIDGSMRAWPRGARWMRRADVRIALGREMAYVGPASRERDQAFADAVASEVARLRATLPPPRP
jgi:1-acyl-sn-glycerol-3-phosphate acyltransferase